MLSTSTLPLVLLSFAHLVLSTTVNSENNGVYVCPTGNGATTAYADICPDQYDVNVGLFQDYIGQQIMVNYTGAPSTFLTTSNGDIIIDCFYGVQFGGRSSCRYLAGGGTIDPVLDPNALPGCRAPKAPTPRDVYRKRDLSTPIDFLCPRVMDPAGSYLNQEILNRGHFDGIFCLYNTATPTQLGCNYNLDGTPNESQGFPPLNADCPNVLCALDTAPPPTHSGRTRRMDAAIDARQVKAEDLRQRDLPVEST